MYYCTIVYNLYFITDDIIKIILKCKNHFIKLDVLMPTKVHYNTKYNKLYSISYSFHQLLQLSLLVYEYETIDIPMITLIIIILYYLYYIRY